MRTPAPVPRDIAADLAAVVLGRGYPCLGATSVFRRGRAVVRDFGSMTDPRTGPELAAALAEFATRYAEQPEFASYLAAFAAERIDDERDFEERLWALLQQVHLADAAPWSAQVSADPGDPHFGFSVGGHAFFVVGMHPRASRIARRTPVPVAVFNLHAQFQRLRAAGTFERMRGTIRRRDLALQGSLNPNLADHATVSEARQYCGRAVEEDWRAPFRARVETEEGRADG